MPSFDWSERIIILDLQNEPDLSEDVLALTDQLSQSDESHDVVLNFRDVEYINSSNLSQLLRLHKEVQRIHGSMRLCCLNGDIASVMEITGLDRVFQIDPDKLLSLAALQLATERGD